jgi:hypothetical protein
MATTWLYVTDDDVDARDVTERLSQILRRPIEEVAGRLPIGPPAACLDLLGRYRDAGLGRVLLWPLKDEVQQLERVASEILPAGHGDHDHACSLGPSVGEGEGLADLDDLGRPGLRQGLLDLGLLKVVPDRLLVVPLEHG